MNVTYGLKSKHISMLALGPKHYFLFNQTPIQTCMKGGSSDRPIKFWRADQALNDTLPSWGYNSPLGQGHIPWTDPFDFSQRKGLSTMIKIFEV